MTHLTAVWSGDGVGGAEKGSDVPSVERTRERPRGEAVREAEKWRQVDKMTSRWMGGASSSG